MIFILYTLLIIALAAWLARRAVDRVRPDWPPKE
jgi:hypothetical protein